MQSRSCQQCLWVGLKFDDIQYQKSCFWRHCRAERLCQILFHHTIIAPIIYVQEQLIFPARHRPDHDLLWPRLILLFLSLYSTFVFAQLSFFPDYRSLHVFPVSFLSALVYSSLLYSSLLFFFLVLHLFPRFSALPHNYSPRIAWGGCPHCRFILVRDRG